MYRKKAGGWLKHLDFILLDLLCLQAAFMLAYTVRMGPDSPYADREYRSIGIVILLADVAVMFLLNTFRDVLKRGYYQEFAMTLWHDCVVEGIVVFYLFTTRKDVPGARFVIYLMALLYVCMGYFSRLFWKAWLQRRMVAAGEQRSLLIVTHERLAADVVEDIREHYLEQYRITGIAVLDRDLRGRKIEGIPVVAGAVDVSRALDTAEALDVSEVRDVTGAVDAVDEPDVSRAPDVTETPNVSGKAGGSLDAAGDADRTAAQNAVRTSDVAGSPNVVGEPNETEKPDMAGTLDLTEAPHVPGESDVTERLGTAGASDVTEAVCRSWVDEAFIVLPREEAYPEELASQLAGMGVVVHVGVYKAQESGGLRQFVGQLGDYTVLTTSISAATPLQQFCKRAMDIAGGIAGCLITAVLTLFLAPAICIASPGPIFFTQERVGRNGKKFRIYKFRSMYPDAEERKKALMERNRHGDGLMFKIEGDPRIIGCKVLEDGSVKKGIGNFIRDHSLDEFPQFLNVLKGDMSLVGTRPPTLDEWERYEPHHRARLAVRPGITGLWQVSGRSRITDFEEVVKLDTKYITEWSMALDLRILVRTVGVVFRKDGAM